MWRQIDEAFGAARRLERPGMDGTNASGTTDRTTTVNRERADRRRAVARTVRDLRERLISTTGTKPAYDYELLLTFARTRLAGAYALPFLVVLLAATALVWIDVALVVGWAALVLAMHVLVLTIANRFTQLASEKVNVKAWSRRFAAADFIYGLAWGTILLFSTAGQGVGLEVFQFSTGLTVIAVGTMLASSVPLAAVTGTLPVALLLAAILSSHGEFLFHTMALMAGGAEAFFLILAARLHSTTLLMIESRAVKDQLIGELETANAISDESRRRAEEANLAKSRFLATMSHELRTPLNAILGFSEVMKNEILGPLANASYKEYIGDIHSSGQHLLNLINEILDLSRIEAGRYELHEEPVNLAYLVEECRHLVSLKARNKNITVIERLEPDLPRLWADERAVRQVVLNLLSNAVKFTQSGGAVEVEVGWTAGGGQYVTVRDNGPGIPEEEIPIVLSAFGQGSIAIKSAEQGTGLGLPIVQALMRTHDGTFELRSKLREGTEAICIFPKARVMEALPPIQDDGRRSRWRRAG